MTDVVFIRIAPFLNEKLFHPRHGIFPFNIGFSIALLERKNISCNLLDTWVNDVSEKGIKKFITKHSPKFVIIESTTKTIPTVKMLHKFSKSQFNSFNIAIGQLASTLPEKLDESTDVCVYGESEKAVEKIITNKDYKKTPRIFNLNNGIVKDLESLPPLNYDHFFKCKYKLLSTHVPIFKKKKWGFLLSSRGCPYNCIYCSPTLRQSYGSKFRFHSKEWVVNELKVLKNKYNVNSVYFADDLFTFDSKRVIELCKHMIKHKLNLKWVIQTRVDSLNKEMLTWMKKAGCTTLCMGVESGNDRVLKVLNKSITKNTIIKKLRLVKKLGFVLDLYFMIGNPTETEKELWETYRLAKRFSPEMLRFAFFTPYPGSRFFDEHPNVSLNAHHYDNLAHNFSNIPSKKLKSLQTLFYRKYYLTPSYLIKYIFKRFPYELSDLNSEASLVKAALNFILRH